MFSSEQILDMSVDFQDLGKTIQFFMKIHEDDMFTRDNGRIKMAFSEPHPGVYAIGFGSMEPYKTGANKSWARKLGNGWTDYPFDYNPDIIARIIEQWVRKQPRPEMPDTDGSTCLGVRVRCLNNMRDEMPQYYCHPDKWDWNDCILLFTPHYNVYHK